MGFDGAVKRQISKETDKQQTFQLQRYFDNATIGTAGSTSNILRTKLINHKRDPKQ